MDNKEILHAFNFSAIHRHLAVIVFRNEQGIDMVDAPVAGYDPYLKVNTAKAVRKAPFIGV